MQGEKFLLVGPLSPPATGQSISFEMLCRELSARDCQLEVVDISRKRPSDSGRFSVTRIIEILQAVWTFLTAMVRGYRRVYITIAQSRAGFVRDFLLIWIAATFRARIVVHLKGGNYDGFYNSQPDWLQRLIKATLHRSSAILVLGEGLRCMYAFDQALVEKTIVVPNGLPIALEGSATATLDPGEPVRVLYLSNMIITKGYWDLLKAAEILKSRAGVSVKFTFAGQFMSSPDDPADQAALNQEARFTEEIEKRELQDCVEYIGPIHGDAKWQLLHDSHFFVLPTAYVNEGQPVSIIEAMAFGCVVISTPYRAIPDLVVDGVTGILIPYGDAERIAGTIYAIAGDSGRFARMSDAAVDRYNRMFTMSAHINTILPHLMGTEAPVKTSDIES